MLRPEAKHRGASPVAPERETILSLALFVPRTLLRQLLRTVDMGYYLAQIVTRSFGFNTLGTASVPERFGSDGLRYAALPPAEARWPGMVVPLPLMAIPMFSVESMLKRGATWKVPESLDQVEAFFDHQVPLCCASGTRKGRISGQVRYYLAVDEEFPSVMGMVNLVADENAFVTVGVSQMRDPARRFRRHAERSLPLADMIPPHFMESAASTEPTRPNNPVTDVTTCRETIEDTDDTG